MGVHPSCKILLNKESFRNLHNGLDTTLRDDALVEIIPFIIQAGG